MANPFNNRLYAQYYPLKKEEDKNELLSSHHLEILKAADNLYRCANNEVFERERSYIDKMKPEVSFLGFPKWRNIARNREIAMKMDADRNIRIAKEKVPEAGSIAYKLDVYEHEKITIEEMNRILRFMNTETHKSWGLKLLFFSLMIIGVCKFLF